MPGGAFESLPRALVILGAGQESSELTVERRPLLVGYLGLRE
jgi:hypothetical protein